MIVLYLAVAGSCAEDKANAGGGSGAGGVPTVSITSLTNLGPTTGTGPIAAGSITAVNMIPSPYLFLHPADCVQLDINFAANGATIAGVTIQAIHTASGQPLTIELASAVQGVGAPLGDGFAYMSNSDSLTLGGGLGTPATDVVLNTPNEIDVVASNGAATTQDRFYFILVERGAQGGQGGTTGVNLRTTDQVDFIVTVTPSTGLAVQATASAIMA